MASVGALLLAADRRTLLRRWASGARGRRLGCGIVAGGSSTAPRTLTLRQVFRQPGGRHTYLSNLKKRAERKEKEKRISELEGLERDTVGMGHASLQTSDWKETVHVTDHSASHLARPWRKHRVDVVDGSMRQRAR